MALPLIFVSCGQRTRDEIGLGESICDLIRSGGKLEAFFAQNQHNLAGLHENIFDALARADAFITVLHPRGVLPYETPLNRASVWIEQEIAIAAFICRREKRQMDIAAYIAKGVGREGLRELLHINPFEFTSNQDVLADVNAKINVWKVKLQSRGTQSDIAIVRTPSHEFGVRNVALQVRVKNSASRANEYTSQIELPAPLLSWLGGAIYGEVQSNRSGYRAFRQSETSFNKAPIARGEVKDFFRLNVSVQHLSQQDIAGLLDEFVYADAELSGNFLETQLSVREIFAPFIVP